MYVLDLTHLYEVPYFIGSLSCFTHCDSVMYLLSTETIYSKDTDNLLNAKQWTFP